MMKNLAIKFLVVLIAAAFFYSCTKSSGDVISSATYIRYKINRQQVTMNGEITSIASGGEGVQCVKQAASPGNGFPAGLYAIQGAKGEAKLISLILVTDSLKTETYNTTDTSTQKLTFVKQESLSYFNGYRLTDEILVRVSRHSNGTIDGTFTGKLAHTRTVDGTTTYIDGLITDGEFKNVPVRY